MASKLDSNMSIYQQRQGSKMNTARNIDSWMSLDPIISIENMDLKDTKCMVNSPRTLHACK